MKIAYPSEKELLKSNSKSGAKQTLYRNKKHQWTNPMPDVCDISNQCFLKTTEELQFRLQNLTDVSFLSKSDRNDNCIDKKIERNRLRPFNFANYFAC